jgi:hypothetical protein
MTTAVLAADAAGLERAATLLRSGGLVAFGVGVMADQRIEMRPPCGRAR